MIIIKWNLEFFFVLSFYLNQGSEGFRIHLKKIKINDNRESITYKYSLILFQYSFLLMIGKYGYAFTYACNEMLNLKLYTVVNFLSTANLFANLKLKIVKIFFTQKCKKSDYIMLTLIKDPFHGSHKFNRFLLSKQTLCEFIFEGKLFSTQHDTFVHLP